MPLHTSLILFNVPHRPPRPAKIPISGQHRRGLAGAGLEGARVGRWFRHHQLPGGEERTPHAELDKSWKHQVS